MRIGAILLLASAGWAGDRIEWASDLAAAKSTSIQSGKLVLLYFTFDT